MTEKNMLKKSATLAAAGLVVAGALLAGCGESEATPMDDAYAGNSGETEKSQEEQSQSQSNGSDSSDGSDSSSSHNDPSTTTSDKKDTGNYKDGNYSINGQYGPVGEDSIERPSDHQGRQRRDRQYHWAPVHHDFQEPSGRLRQSH